MAARFSVIGFCPIFGKCDSTRSLWYLLRHTSTWESSIFFLFFCNFFKVSSRVFRFQMPDSDIFGQKLTQGLQDKPPQNFLVLTVTMCQSILKKNVNYFNYLRKFYDVTLSSYYVFMNGDASLMTLQPTLNPKLF